MLDLWIWMIEKLNLFKDFSEKGINASFHLPVMLTFVIIFIIFVFLAYRFVKDEFDLIYVLYSLIAASFVTMILCLTSLPSNPSTLIKTDLVKETTTTLIPSEGVTEASLLLKESGEKIQPSTLKDGDELTLIVKVGENSFKKDFRYEKENLKIVRGKKDEVKKAFVKTKQFKDELFGKTRER